MPRVTGAYLFPAHAGMNRRAVLFAGPDSTVPRTRGDEPENGMI